MGEVIEIAIRMIDTDKQAQEPKIRLRRRGDNLTDSIYATAIEILRRDGYHGLTFQTIAQEAKTSRAVLYRRWETPFDLVHDFVKYKFATVLKGDFIDMIKDTGSLRNDLLLLLELYQTIYDGIGREVMNVVLFEMSQNNNKAIDIIKRASQSNKITMRKLLELAESRGELVKTVSGTTLILPFNLFRAEYMFRFEPVHKSEFEKWIDEILLPVFRL